MAADGRWPTKCHSGTPWALVWSLKGITWASMNPGSFVPPVNDSTSHRFVTALRRALQALGIALHPAQIARMTDHYRALLEANRRFNLTRITDPAEAAVKHYADSLAPLAWPHRRLPDGLRVLDVGTGAGFPAVPLAIARPGWQVTAVDGTAKKIGFVADCGRRLGLTNLHALHTRVETLPLDGDPFDLISFRAVGKLAECFRLALPYLARAGLVVCWKAATIAPGEFHQALRAARRMGFSSPRCWAYELVGMDSPRRHQLVWAELER